MGRPRGAQNKVLLEPAWEEGSTEDLASDRLRNYFKHRMWLESGCMSRATRAVERYAVDGTVYGPDPFEHHLDYVVDTEMLLERLGKETWLLILLRLYSLTWDEIAKATGYCRKTIQRKYCAGMKSFGNLLEANHL